MANSVPTRPSLRSRPLADLTRAVFGETMTIDEVFRRLESGDANADDHFDRTSPVIPTPLVPSPPADTPTARDAVWVGSTGYERHKVSDDFVRLLAQAGVERLIDVRELPISRRRGYAKPALADALAQPALSTDTSDRSETRSHTGISTRAGERQKGDASTNATYSSSNAQRSTS